MKNFLTLIFCLTIFSLQAQVLTEDFENGIPDGWSLTSTDWVLTDGTNFTSQYFNPPAHTNYMGFNDDAAGNSSANSGEIITSMIDLTGVESPAVTFDTYFINGDYQADETAKVNVSTDGGTTWTEVFSIEEGQDAWQTINVPLLDYIDQTIMLSFAYGDGDGWQYGWCIDDIVVGSYVPPVNDVEFLGFNQGCMQGEVGRDAYFKGYLINRGVAPLTSVDLNFTVNGNTQTESITGINIATGETYQFVHPAPHTITMGASDIDFSITNPSGVEDENMSNNSYNFSITGVDVEEGQGVVIEEATGTWCTFCPRGAVLMDMMSHCFPDNFVGVAVHNADPMAETAYDNFVTGQPNFTGFPSVLFNRESIMALDGAALTNLSIQRMQQAPTVSLSMSADWDATTRVIDARVFAEFIEAPGAGAKWVGVITEDNVTGTENGYAQINAYAGGALGSTGGYEALPSPVPAAEMVYDLVGRAGLTAYTGVGSTDLDDVQAGDGAFFNFDSYTLPADYNSDEISLLAILIDADGQVINAKKVSLNTAATTGIDPVQLTGAKVRVFPNPASDVANVRLTLDTPMNVNVEVFNVMGQVVATRNYGLMVGDEIIRMNVSQFATGTYMVRIALDNQVITKQIVVD